MRVLLRDLFYIFAQLVNKTIKMRKIYIISCLLVALSLLSFTKGEQETTQPLTGALLWEVSGNGLSKPSYILGSYHVEGKDFVEENIKGLQGAFNNSNVVVGELNMLTMQSEMATMQQAMMMSADTTYEMLLSDDDRKLLNEKLTSLIGAGLDQLAVMKPSALQTLYMLTLLTKKTGMQSVGMDSYYQIEGQKQGKKVQALETVKQQSDLLFCSESLAKQASDLMCGLKNEDYTMQSLDQLDSLYKAQDLAGMYIFSNDSVGNPCYTNDDFMNKLTTVRNNNWMKILPGMMQKDSHFVVVGALHLCGDTGILKQLLDLGYTLTPVH